MTLRRVLIGGGIVLALALVIFLAVLVGIFIGRGEQEEVAQTEDTEEQKTEAAENTSEAPKQNTPSKTIPPQSVVVEVGETGELPDRNMTVNDIQHGYRYPQDIPRPASGNEFVIVNVTITNTSDRPITVNPAFDFQSEDSNGVRYNAQSSNQHPDAIPLGSIAPNGELTGNLVVEAPQGEPVIKLVYRPLA